MRKVIDWPTRSKNMHRQGASRRVQKLRCAASGCYDLIDKILMLLRRKRLPIPP